MGKGIVQVPINSRKDPAATLDTEAQTAATLGACCLFLSSVEYLIPKPLPFMRLGLANLPLLLALDIFSWKSYVRLVLIKILGQGLIAGTFLSPVFLFSLTGTAASAGVMYLLRRGLGEKRTGFTGVSVAGALVSNGIQLLLAHFFIFGGGIRMLIPPFLAAGLVTGCVLGLFAEAFTARSVWYRRWYRRWYHRPLGLVPPPPVDRAGSGGTARLRRTERFLVPVDCFLAGLVMALAFLLNPSTARRAVQLLIFALYAGLSGRKIRPGAALLMSLGVVAGNLLVPYGKVLAEFGAFRITRGSLLAGIHKAITLEGLFLLSGAAILPGLRLPGTLGALIGESFRLLHGMHIPPLKRLLFRQTAWLDAVDGIDRLLGELSAGQGTVGITVGITAGVTAAPCAPKRTLRSVLLLAVLALPVLALGLFP